MELGCQFLHLPLPLLRTCEEEIRQASLVGCSVHSLEQVKEAEKLGADYLIAGHIYATQFKVDIPPRGLDFLKSLCNKTSLPVYAIGGIRLDLEQMAEIKECGAEGGCVMSEMMKI